MSTWSAQRLVSAVLGQHSQLSSSRSRETGKGREETLRQHLWVGLVAATSTTNQNRLDFHSRGDHNGWVVGQQHVSANMKKKKAEKNLKAAPFDSALLAAT